MSIESSKQVREAQDQLLGWGFWYDDVHDAYRRHHFELEPTPLDEGGEYGIGAAQIYDEVFVQTSTLIFAANSGKLDKMLTMIHDKIAAPYAGAPIE